MRAAHFPRVVLAVVLATPSVPLAAQTTTQALPRIVGITLSGNAHTRDQVILRELDLAPGDPADPARIERGRQAVSDLGLFREVTVTAWPAAEGVVLRVAVREKRFVLVLPRVDAGSDQDVSYGAQLRWANVWGRNHRLNLVVESGDFPEERDRREEKSARLSYRAPYLFDSPYELRTHVQRIERVTPVIDPASNEVTDDSFDETFDNVELGAARDLRTSRPRTGWIVGGGLLWQRQTASGAFAPPPDGRALALVGTADYNDIRFQLFRDTGRRFSARLEAAADGLGSDYGYTRATVDYFESRPIGRAGQTLEAAASAGVLDGGPGSRNAFSLGGSSRMRAYDSDDFEGNRFYYGSLQYLRPVKKWQWLRLMAFVEAGGTGDDREGLRDGSPYADIGVGVRIRLTWFVNVEFQAGWAYPLRGGDGGKFFASSH